MPLTVDAGNGTVTSSAITMRDDYYYDSLNRLKQVQGYQLPSGGSWNNIYQQTFSYDQYGNRKIKNDETWGNAINNADYTINTANNRVNGSEYDAAGNVKSDLNGPNQMAYDAENRMKSALKNGQWNYYVYDAEGKRVRRVLGGTEYWQVYGFGGELIAEYPVNGAASTPQTEYGYREGQMLVVGGCDVVCWIVADSLGTPRMEIDPSGSLSAMRRHDNLPFGEELLVGMGDGSIRSTEQGYTADCVKQRFTGYEKDDETSLDFAQERYYSNRYGRFLSHDPLMASATTQNPQTWNRFTYVINNPLRYIDPGGMIAQDAWSLLTREEQKIIAPKLKRGDVELRGGKTRKETAREAFNKLIYKR